MHLFLCIQSEDDKRVKKKVKPDDGKAGGSKIKCMYWEKCYRKDPYHLAQYRHPATTLGTKGRHDLCNKVVADTGPWALTLPGKLR